MTLLNFKDKKNILFGGQLLSEIFSQIEIKYDVLEIQL